MLEFGKLTYMDEPVARVYSNTVSIEAAGRSGIITLSYVNIQCFSKT